MTLPDRLAITSVRVERRGAHDHVHIHVDGKLSGTLVVDAGDGWAFSAKLQGLGAAEEWLVKDFNVLYRAARAVVNTEPDARGNVDGGRADHLERQIARLRPAYEMTENVLLHGRAHEKEGD